MRTAPRKGEIVALMTDHGDIIIARYGRLDDDIFSGGWFEQDWEDSVGNISYGLLTDYDETDEGFIGWCELPKPKKPKKEAVLGGASCQPSEQHRPETTPNDERKS